MTTAQPPRVAYLFGAGATQACVKAVGSSHGVLMRDLSADLNRELGDLVRGSKYGGDPGLVNLVNDVIDEETDFEHLITFLADAPSALHREFADEVRQTFEAVLRSRFESIDEELGESPTELYQAVFDMYRIPDFSETLVGCLTLNYDEYIERAIDAFTDLSVDLGLVIDNGPVEGDPVKLLKLHGSFGWEDVWPIHVKLSPTRTLWIPPGIHKGKESYPFNVLWGKARDLLNCDILRVIGCRLGPNDWDLISLLFTTRHASRRSRPYRIEIIDAPQEAERLKRVFPYLSVQSLLEIDEIGAQLISEEKGGAPQDFRDLDPNEQRSLLDDMNDRNWFFVWLKLKLEIVYRELGTIATDTGTAARLMEKSA